MGDRAEKSGRDGARLEEARQGRGEPGRRKRHRKWWQFGRPPARGAAGRGPEEMESWEAEGSEATANCPCGCWLLSP